MACWRIAFLLPLIPSVVFGLGFDTNVWPAWEYPRQGFTHATQCVAAFNERAYAWNMSSPVQQLSYTNTGTNGSIVTNFLFRDNRTTLIEIKQKMRTIIEDDWVVPSYFNVTLATNSLQLPYYSNVVQLCYDTGLPTNFFNYTPYRNLDGLGTFGTNDDDYTGVGHYFGWTNSYTIQGGTNFTGGRTKWYTTDYGWDGMKSVLNTCRWVRADVTGGKMPYSSSGDIQRVTYADVRIGYGNTNSMLFDDGGAQLATEMTSNWFAYGVQTNTDVVSGISPGPGVNRHYCQWAYFEWRTNFSGGTNYEWRGTQLKQSRTFTMHSTPTGIPFQIFWWAIFRVPRGGYMSADSTFDANRDIGGVAGGSATTPGITNRMLFQDSYVYTNVPHWTFGIGTNDGSEIWDDIGFTPDMRGGQGYGNDALNPLKAAVGLQETNIIMLFKPDFKY